MTLLSVFCHIYSHYHHFFTCWHTGVSLTHFQLPDFLVILSSFSCSVILTRSFSLSFLMFALLLLLSQSPCKKQSQHVQDIEIKTPTYVQEGPTMSFMFPLIFIPFLPTEPNLCPVYKLNSHVEGPASCFTDQVSTREGVDLTDFSHMHATVHIRGICINTVGLFRFCTYIKVKLSCLKHNIEFRIHY